MSIATTPSAAPAQSPDGTSSQESVQELPVGLKLGWSSGAFGIAILMNGISGLILLFMVSMLQVDPWLAGVVIFTAKLFDVVTDPVVGLWSDKHRSPRGRRRPFLFWGSLLCAASFALIFTAPMLSSQYFTAGYMLGVLCLYAFAYTLFNIPYMAMPAEMTDSYHERSSIHAYRVVMVSMGGFIAGAGVKWALERLGKTDPESYAIVGLICAGMILVSTMIAYFSTAKGRFSEARENNASRSNLGQLADEFNAVKSNRNFLRLIGVKFAQLMGMQTTIAGFAYFVVQYMERDFDIFVLFGIVSTAATIISAPLMVRFSKRYGKKAAYYLAATLNIIYALSWSLASEGEPLWAIAVRAAIVGVALTGNVVMAMSMLTDIINEDAGRTGVRREGAFTALYSFVEKLTGAIGPLIVGVALTFAGFNNKLPFDVPQGGNVDIALLMAVSWLPAAFGLIAVWLLSGYELDEAAMTSADEAKPAST